MREFEKQVQVARVKLLEMLGSARITNGKFTVQLGNITKELCVTDRKATLHFLETAYMKMNALVDGFSSEVAWHGVAYRGEDETKDEYYITDILCYPQEVSGAKVDTDQQEYQSWMFELDDESFNNLKAQGHSHVHMGVTPSTTDEENQKEILTSLNDEDFYIFMIWNKKREKNIKIYDMKKNVLFEPSDVTVVIDDEGIGLDKFLSDAKGMVKEKKFTYSGAYYAGGAKVTSAPTPSAAPAPVPAVKTTATKVTDKPVKAIKDVKTTPKNASYKPQEDWDDDDDYYGWPKSVATDPFGYGEDYRGYMR